MKTIALALCCALFIGCAGIERVQAKHRTDSQLKLRLIQIDRELQGVQARDAESRDVSLLQTERDAIERELLHRYERGDTRAYLPQFQR